MVLPAGQGQVPHPSIVPECFTINQLWNDRCTWPWGHCLLSELREWSLQTGRHNRLKRYLGGKREARELKERQETREYELERLRLSNATETVSVSSADLEGQGVNRRVNSKDLVPKFDAKNADINLFFEIFERQAIKEKVAEDRWVSQLIPLLPIEIAEIVAKEPLEKSDDYPHIKSTLGPVPTHAEWPR
ncbi:uncharacterized protein TNCV_4221621 [Trichonephila clavipes]|nr:uncharacterized protein TNCV_4221621 [Trichonephila clavipes]